MNKLVENNIEKAIDLMLEQDQNEFLEMLKDEGRIDKYIIRPDGLVDVDGNVDITNLSLKELLIKFGVVTGYFNCSHNQLTSLIGCPEKVGGGFDCSNNQLTSLIGCPEKVGGSFYCRDNQLTSLIGCPENVNGNFDCTNNQLTSLEDCPEKVGGSFWCTNNQLTSLRGCPEEVGCFFYCNGNPVEFTKEDIELAKQGKAPLGLPLSFVLMKNKEKLFRKRNERPN